MSGQSEVLRLAMELAILRSQLRLQDTINDEKEKKQVELLQKRLLMTQPIVQAHQTSAECSSLSSRCPT